MAPVTGSRTRRCAVLLSGFCWATTLQGAEGQPARPPIIDMHVHAYEPTASLVAVRAQIPAMGAPDAVKTGRDHLAATLAVMERFNIVKAVVSHCEASADVLTEWRKAAPHRVLAATICTDPLTPLPILREGFKSGRWAVMAELGAQYQGIGPGDPALEPYFALAEELDVPVGLHMGLGPPGAAYHGSPKYRMSLSNPLLLEDVLLRHPKLRIYVMHAGWPMIDAMIGLLWAHPQVYVDVGVIDWAIERKEFHGYLRRLVEAGFGDRILFGSDQMEWPEAIAAAIEGIESADFLSPAQKQAIFYDNAARFLRLDSR